MGPKKEDYLTLIKANAAKLSADKILSEEISVLLGISDSTVKILKQLDIHTVFDLASSRIFNNALTITNAAADPDTLESRLAATPTGMVDKSISNKSYDEIKDLSTRYLHGIGHRKHDEVVKVVKSDTIRDFAYWPPFVAAKKIYRVKQRVSGS